MPDDVRISDWSLTASAGMTTRLQFTAPTALDSLSVYTGGTVSDVDDLTDATEHAGTLSSGDTVATVDLVVDEGAGVESLRLAVNGAVVSVGYLNRSSRGVEVPDNTITLTAAEVEYDLTVLGVLQAEGGGGGGTVESVVAGTNIDVDATDPANPIVSLETLVDADIPASIARDAEVTAAIASLIAGDGSIETIVALTQAEYDALTPDPTTYYIITDATGAGGVESVDGLTGDVVLSGTYVSLIAETIYDPGSIATYSTTSATHANADSSNLVLTGTVPADGELLVELEALCTLATNTAEVNASLLWSLMSDASTVVTGTIIRAVLFRKGATTGSDAPQARVRVTKRLTGLTPGAAFSYRWGLARDSGNIAVRFHAGGGIGAAVMRAWSAPTPF